MSRFGTLGTQFFDDSGDPLVSGEITFYEPGTATKKNTYKERSLTTANTNPVVLNAAGRLDTNVYFEGIIDAVLKTSAGATIETRYNVGQSSFEPFTAWSSSSTYDQNQIVKASDENFYRSLNNNNQGNNPTSSSTNWVRVEFVEYWNTNVTYDTDDVAMGSDGLIYTSVTSSNQGNDPTTDTAGTNWRYASGKFSKYDEYNSSATWTKDSRAQFVFVECIGGGGAGGNSTYGGGGSGGGYASALFDADDLPATVSASVGAGAVNNSTGSGGNGGTTSFGAYLSAPGGIGGNTSNTTTCVNPAGSQNSYSSNGSDAPALNVGRQDSGYGAGASASAIPGGNSIRGGAGGGSSSTTTAGTSVYGGNGGIGSAGGAAGNGVAPGGGGGGSGSNSGSNGGNGAAGRVRVWQW